MSTPSRPPASEAPRQLTVPLPLKFDLEDDESNYDPDIPYASSSTHLVLGYKNSVCIYSLPAFDLVDTIHPGNLVEHKGSLRVYGRFLVVMHSESYGSNAFEDRCLLYIWDLLARKHIGTVIRNSQSYQVYMSVSLPSAKISEDGKLEGTSQKWPQDPVLIVASPMQNTLKGATYGIHLVRCLASAGRTALTGGWDGTVRAWDIIVGKCQMVFIGHTDAVDLVDLDEERIYSSSYDNTIRVWDRYKGDCLHVHVLEVVKSPADIFFTPSYIVALANASELSIWDIVSGKLEHRINNQPLWDLGSFRRTLATIEHDELNQSIFWVRIWDLRSGQPIRTSSFEPGFLKIQRFFQGRFFIGISKEDEGHVLKVWDFGDNDAEYGEVRDDDHGNSRDNSIDKIKEVTRDDCRMSVSPSPSSSAVEGAMAGNSMIASKRKRSPTPDLFPKRKREKNDEHDEQVSTSQT
ncbi:hypothetical protein CVT26_012049 [Gymnopilus dilepis]|uniref:Uncharacterized protein n=1 Tax=Gymnopilus dilepis TaxID=231916 RepID=A0A409WP29_9AGAR|nr:hypothetical protein CVT26_012049 [Gymnopilus dilepis]